MAFASIERRYTPPEQRAVLPAAGSAAVLPFLVLTVIALVEGNGRIIEPHYFWPTAIAWVLVGVLVTLINLILIGMPIAIWLGDRLKGVAGLLIAFLVARLAAFLTTSGLAQFTTRSSLVSLVLLPLSFAVPTAVIYRVLVLTGRMREQET